MPFNNYLVPLASYFFGVRLATVASLATFRSR